MVIGNVILILLVGALAGWLAGWAVNKEKAFTLGDVALGVIGALVGGYLFDLVGVGVGFGLLGQLLVAFIGAVLVTLAWNAINKR